MPTYSDKHGKKNLIVASLVVMLISQIGLMASNSLYFGYLNMFLLGSTFPGKNIVFYGYTMEIVDPEYRQTVVNIQTACETTILILISMYY